MYFKAGRSCTWYTSNASITSQHISHTFFWDLAARMFSHPLKWLNALTSFLSAVQFRLRWKSFRQNIRYFYDCLEFISKFHCSLFVSWCIFSFLLKEKINSFLTLNIMNYNPFALKSSSFLSGNIFSGL